VTLVHEIHSSELRGYRRCRQSWDWRYRANWEPIRKPAPLEDGTVWHKALEVIYDPANWDSLHTRDLYAKALNALIVEAAKQKDEYLRRAGKPTLDDDEAVDYGERITILRSMLGKLCSSLDRQAYRVLAVEQEFQCPILDEEGIQLTCRCYRCWNQFQATGDDIPGWGRVSTIPYAMWMGTPVVFSCRIDALFEDHEEYVYAVDHKSTSVLYKPDSVIPELDEQLPSYAWCLRQNNYPVTGLILNQFRKAYPRPPKRLDRLQLGRAHSVNKTQLTDYDTAWQTFRQYDPDAFQKGLYNDYLAWLRECGPVYSRQFMYFKTSEQLDIVGRHILDQAYEVINQEKRIYPNPSQTTCERCAFQLPCFAVQSGRNPQEELEAGFVQTEPYYITRRQS
jgi:hypothetical protein